MTGRSWVRIPNPVAPLWSFVNFVYCTSLNSHGMLFVSEKDGQSKEFFFKTGYSTLQTGLNLKFNSKYPWIHFTYSLSMHVCVLSYPISNEMQKSHVAI